MNNDIYVTTPSVNKYFMNRQNMGKSLRSSLRPKSAQPRRQRKFKRTTTTISPIKKKKRIQSASAKRKGRKKMIYTGSEDMKNLQRRFQKDIIYNTMPWMSQSETSIHSNKSKQNDYAKKISNDYAISSSKKQIIEIKPIFDQWLIGPGGKKYLRQSSLKNLNK